MNAHTQPIKRGERLLQQDYHTHRGLIEMLKDAKKKTREVKLSPTAEYIRDLKSHEGTEP